MNSQRLTKTLHTISQHFAFEPCNLSIRGGFKDKVKDVEDVLKNVNANVFKRSFPG